MHTPCIWKHALVSRILANATPAPPHFTKYHKQTNLQSVFRVSVGILSPTNRKAQLLIRQIFKFSFLR